MATAILRFIVGLVFVLFGCAPVAAQTCSAILGGSVEPPPSWLPSSGLPLLFESTIDEWDSDVLKIRLRRAGLLVLGNKELEVDATFYQQTSTGVQAITTSTPVGPTTDQLAQWLEAGTYCVQIEAGSTGTYELEIQYFDGCDLKEVAEAADYCDEP